MIGARDLRSFCRPPMGVPVSFAGVSNYPDDGTLVCGLFDRPVQFKLEDGGTGGIAAGLPELRLPFNAFAIMPAEGDEITVSDPDTGIVTYSVNTPTAEDDGGYLCYQLFLTA